MQQNDQPAVSIIVPVYNTEKYLSRCLDSILNQSLQSIEVICIDDGSTDQSLEILKEYMRLDARVKVLTQENQGPCESRNRGIRIAHGRYIGFVDSDDWIAPAMYERLVSKAVQDDCDLVLCDFYQSQLGRLTYARGYTGHKLTVEEFMRISAPPYLCMKLFQSNLKEHMLTATGKNQAEDVALLYPLLPHVKKLGYIPEPLYYYYQRADSSSNADNFVVQYGIDEYLSTIRRLFQLDYGRYTPLAKKHFVQMIYWGLKTPSRKPFLADYIEFLQEVSPHLIGNSELKQFQDLSQYLCHETIPKTLVRIKKDIHNPSADICVESWKYYARNCTVEEIETDFYTDMPEIVVQAKNAGEQEFVEDYLKLRYVYENGGMAISDSVKLNRPIGELRTYPAFFGYKDQKNINTDFWGAVKGYPLLEIVLQSYEADSIINQIDVNLGLRLYFALSSNYKLPQKDANEHSLIDNVRIFRCDKLTYKVNSNNVAQIYNNSTAYAEENGLVTAPQSVIEMLILEARKDEKRKKGVSNDKILNNCQEELERIKNSRSWRFTRPLRKLFNFFRKVKYPDCEIQ